MNTYQRATALALPDRPVLALSGDGSALYTLQALWTAARQGGRIAAVAICRKCDSHGGACDTGMFAGATGNVSGSVTAAGLESGALSH